MTDSQDQPRRGSREANFPVAPTNNSQLHPESTRSGDTSNSSSNGLGFDEWLDMRKKLVGLEAEEAELRFLDSVADLAEAEAEEAGHQAAAESHRQAMSLREREVKLKIDVTKIGMAVLVTLAIIVITIAVSIVSPWFLPLNLLIACLGVWAGSTAIKHRRQPEDQDPGP